MAVWPVMVLLVFLLEQRATLPAVTMAQPIMPIYGSGIKAIIRGRKRQIYRQREDLVPPHFPLEQKDIWERVSRLHTCRIFGSTIPQEIPGRQKQILPAVRVICALRFQSG